MKQTISFKGNKQFWEKVTAKIKQSDHNVWEVLRHYLTIYLESNTDGNIVETTRRNKELLDSTTISNLVSTTEFNKQMVLLEERLSMKMEQKIEEQVNKIIHEMFQPKPEETNDQNQGNSC